jgi:hypothetical protein
LWKVAAPVTLPTNSGWVLTGKLTESIRGINSDLGPLSWPSLPFDAPLFSPFERRSPNPFPINNYALRRLNPEVSRPPPLIPNLVLLRSLRTTFRKNARPPRLLRACAKSAA